MLPLPEVILAATVLLLTLLCLFFFARFVRERQRSLFITKNQDKSFELLNDAVRKAQEILNKAAVEEIDAVAASKAQSEKLEQIAEASLQTTTLKAEGLLGQEMQQMHSKMEMLNVQLQKAQQDYIHYLQSLQLTSDQTKELAQEAITRSISDQAMQIKTQLNVFIEQLETDLTTFLRKSEEQSVHSLELELKSARQMVETYKQQQFVLIDENIIAILERTLSLVLTKKLTLKDHVDLVYESLEKAKLEKFIG